MEDAYVCLRGSGTHRFGTPSGEGSLVFVDLDERIDVSDLLRLPPRVTVRRATLLIRVRDGQDDNEADAIRTVVIEDLKLSMHVGLLHQPCGEEPWVQVIHGTPITDWRRARSAEMRALLEFGRAIWQPDNYHYRLPSGEHAATFVKVGDAVREPRDAVVIASWLARHMGDDVSFVFDTGTLSAVAEAVRRRMVEARLHPGGVAVLDRYPLTDVDVVAAIEYAAGREGAVCGVLSINSTGAVRDRMYRALNVREKAYGSTTLEVLADRGRSPIIPKLETWTQLELPSSSLDDNGSTQNCTLCRDPKRAPLVPIDPTTFDGKLPLQVRLLMPETRAPRQAAPLWERAFACKAVSVQADSSTAVQAHRLTPRMGVIVDIEPLLGDEAFIERSAARLREEMARSPGPNEQPLFEIKPSDCLVLVPEHEQTQKGFERFWEEMGKLFGDIKPTPFNVEHAFTTDLEERVQKARQIIVFSLGMVTGTSLQRALVGVQGSRASTTKDTDYTLGGLIVHARPATSREWQTLINSYAGLLRAAWLTLLPDASPLEDELSTLQAVDVEGLSSSAVKFHEQRSELCSGGFGRGPQAVFWGCSADHQLTPHSIFGNKLDVTTAYASVGSALAHARAKAAASSAPEQRVFEMGAMLHSYYDPLIVAGFLRWLAPYEVWWGWQDRDAERTVTALIDRARNSNEGKDLEIVLPELLLASSQGKLSSAARRVVIDWAHRIDRESFPDTSGAFELGLHLADRVLHESDRPVVTEPG